MAFLRLLSACFIGAIALSACVSTTWNGYPEGTVKYS